ncbi:MAG: phosphoadenylyl-sulfate reductase [Pseudomonadota bacterium]
MPLSPSIPLRDRLPMLNRFHNGWAAQDILTETLSGKAGNVALVSSFGAESVVLLHMVSQLDRATPVIFIDTLMLFRATLAYQRDVAAFLGLTNIQHVTPDTNDLLIHDVDGLLHQADTNACCALRKVAPLQTALDGFDTWITGRKRHQSSARANLPLWEDDGMGRAKVNPLRDWSAADLTEYMTQYNLPRHPLVSQGYASIGCAPCTYRPAPGLDARSGRWAGQDKTECGIHLPAPTARTKGT